MKTLDVAMRMSADMAEVPAEAQKVDQALDGVEASAKKTQKALDGAAQAADRAGKAKKRLAKDADQAAAGQERVAKSSGAAAKGVEQVATAADRTANSQRKAAAATDAATRANERNGLSAKQQAQAMRQLPMQITDIVVGLSSGQSPFMVAIQQGGQLKDSFGGVVPAARALLGAINPLVIAGAAVAASIGATAKATWDGYQELERYERATITTGQASGVSASQFMDMATSIDNATLRFGQGREAMFLLMESGNATAASLENAATAAVALSELTGASIEDTTDQIQKLLQEPAKYSAELNKQYNYLQASIYEQILALERQGQATEAQRLATEALASASTQRLAEVTESLGVLEKGWHYVKVGAAAAWDEMLGIGRQDTLADGVRDAQDQLVGLMERRRKLLAVPEGDRSWIDQNTIDNLTGQILTAQDRYIKAQRAMNSEQEEADRKRTDRETENAAIAAQSRAESYRSQDRAVAKAQELTRLEKDLAAARKANLTELGGFSLADYEKSVRSTIEERYKAPKTPKGPKSEAQRSEEDARRELQNLTKQIALLDALEEGETKASEAARIRFEIEEGAFRNASPRLKQQLTDQAKILDTERLRVESARKLVDVELEIQRLQGRGQDAELTKTTKALRELKQDLETLGKSADAAKVSKLLGLTEASADLRKLQSDYGQVMAEIGLEQQRIQVELQAGLETEAGAQQRIVDLYRSKLSVLREMVPQMRAAAVALGDPAALAAVEQIELKLQEMANTTNLLQQTITNTFQGAFTNALTSLIDGTASLTEAVQGFFVTMAQGMSNFIAQQWAEQLSAKVGELGNRLFGDGVEAATDTAQAAATQASAAALSAAGTTVAAGATAVGTSAATLATSGGTLLTGAAAISAAAVQLQAAAASMLAANAAGSASGFASGGLIRGPGTGTSDSILARVSTGEFVVRAKAVKQYGTSLLHAINERRLGHVPAFADGGLVTAAPALASMPSASSAIAPEGAGRGNLSLAVRPVVVYDEEEAAAVMLSAAGERAFKMQLQRQASFIKQVVTR